MKEQVIDCPIMDFIFLVCHTKEETKIQEFSLPLNIEKIEKWSDLIDISLQKIIIESPFKLFEEKEFKVDTEQVPILKVEAGYSYFLTGSTNDQKKLDILKKITELSEIEASNLLEAFGSIESAYVNFLKNQNSIMTEKDLKGLDLFKACKDGQLTKLEALLSCDFCDPTYKDVDGNSCLHFACLSNKPKLIELFSKSDLFNQKTYTLGYAPIHLACFNGNYDIVYLLNTKYNINLNVKTNQGLSCLHVSAKSRNGPFNDPCKTLKFLVSKGLNINEQDPILKQTPLHVAIQYHRDLEVIKTLLSLGADCNIQDFLGRTPAHIAKEVGNESCYNLLKPHTDLFKTDIKGISAHPSSKSVKILSTICINDILDDKRIDLDPFHHMDSVYAKKSIVGMSKYFFENTEEAIQTFHEIQKLFEISLQLRNEVTEGPLATMIGTAFLNGGVIIFYGKSNSMDEIKLNDEEVRIGVCLQLIRIIEKCHKFGLVVKNISTEYIRLVKNLNGSHEFQLMDAGITVAYKRDDKLKSMIPDDILLEKSFDNRLDQYLLGLTIFEIYMQRPFERSMKIQGPSSLRIFVELFEGCIREDRLTLKEIFDLTAEFNKEFIFDLIKAGKYEYQCTCPKKHSDEEIISNQSYKTAGLINYHEKDLKTLILDDTKLIYESENNVFMNTKWKEFLEKYLLGGYKDSTGESLSDDEIKVLENMKTFIFDEPKNKSLFTLESVLLIDKLVNKMTKNWHTSIDLLQRLVTINHSLQLIIHTKNTIFDKIFSLKWLDLNKPSKVLILKLFTHMIGKEEESINYSKNKIDKIITFAILGLKDQDKGINTQAIHLISNLSVISFFIKTNYENLLNSFLDSLNNEDKTILLPLHRFLRNSQIMKMKTKKFELILQKWISLSSIQEAILTMYQIMD